MLVAAAAADDDAHPFVSLQGCLAPVKVHIPDACLLNPSPEAAVVRGDGSA